MIYEWLNNNLYPYGGETACNMKQNGHWQIFGNWEYPKGICHDEYQRMQQYIEYDPSLKTWIPNDQLSIGFNNETMFIRMIIIGGVSVSKYGYLQTYAHIPRGNPDINGYYARSTYEEVVRYLDFYLQKIKSKEYQRMREEKLHIILAN